MVFILTQDFYFLGTRFFFIAVRKKLLLQVKNILWQENNCFVTLSEKKIGIKKHFFCGKDPGKKNINF